MPVQCPLSTLAMKRNNICTLHKLVANYTWNSMLTPEGYGKDSDSRHTPEFDIQDNRPQVYYGNSGLLSKSQTFFLATFGSFPELQWLFYQELLAHIAHLLEKFRETKNTKIQNRFYIFLTKILILTWDHTILSLALKITEKWSE